MLGKTLRAAPADLGTDYGIEALVEGYHQRDRPCPLEITGKPLSLGHVTARFRGKQPVRVDPFSRIQIKL